jgi:hypothetical protein
MIIHKGNIEAYLLDYLEGNLDPLLTAELMAFLAENPDYEKWLPEYNGHLCITGGPSFENKSVLKKDFRDIPAIEPGNFDEFCIASVEGLLQEEDTARLQDYLSRHPENQADYTLFGELKLKPDLSLVYPGKARLKKRGRAIVSERLLYYALGAAAAVALLLLITGRKLSGPESATALIPTTPGVDRGHTALPEKIIPVMPAQAVREGRKYSPPSEKRIPVNPVAGSVMTSIPVSLPLASLEPIHEFRIASDLQVPDLQGINRKSPVPASDNKALPPLLPDEDRSALKLLANTLKKLNFWKAAETAVSGFNYLTESQLSISKSTDQNGKLTGLGLSTEQYVISGNKLK